LEIIGGADGPTSIFITSGNSFNILLATLVIIIISYFIMKIFKKKQSKKS